MAAVGGELGLAFSGGDADGFTVGEVACGGLFHAVGPATGGSIAGPGADGVEERLEFGVAGEEGVEGGFALVIPGAGGHGGEALAADGEDVFLASFPPGHAEAEDMIGGFEEVGMGVMGEAVVDVLEAFDVELVAIPGWHGGEHGARVVVDNVKGIPGGVDDGVAGLDHVGGREFVGVPVHVDDVLVDFAFVGAEAWAFPDEGASAFAFDEFVEAVDEGALEFFVNSESFIASDMDVGRGFEDVHHLGENGGDSGEGGLEGGELGGRFAEDFGVEIAEDGGVAGDIEFGDEGDAAGLAV